MKAKKIVGRSNQRRSKERLAFIRKGHIKGGEHIAPKDCAEYLRKSDVSENSKLYYGRFLR